MRTFSSPENALQFLLKQVPWGNAAGTCKDAATAEKFAQVSIPNVMFGSITMEPRAGNEGDNFYCDPRTGDSINALGLPNRGLKAYLPELAGIKDHVGLCGSRLWVSISAGNSFSPAEYAHMAKMLKSYGAADVIEGNFSCPNVEVGGKRKSVVCFDLPSFRDGVQALREGAGDTPIAVKIAPITEARLLGDLIEVCLEYRVEYIVAANTIGNCYLEKEDGKPAIPMVRGGLAGRALRPLIRGMIQMVKPQIKNTGTKLIAVGGIETGTDAYEYLRLGADGFAFNTVLSKNGNNPRVVEEMIFGDPSGIGHPGLVDILVQHGLPD